MSLVDDAPLWTALAPYVRIQTYDRDGGHAHPRHRIEVRTPSDPAARLLLLALRAPCVACGAPVALVRQRRGATSTCYLAVTCPLRVSYACARSQAAAAEYERIVEAMRR